MEEIEQITNKHDNGISEEYIINKDYFNLIKNQQLLTCCICTKLLNEPLMCSSCQISCCKLCIDSWLLKSNVCPMQCQEYTYIEVSKVLKSIMDELKIKCNICGNETTLLKYPEHIKKCKNVKCFNCGSEVNLPQMKIHSKRKKDMKFMKDPIQLPKNVENYLVFHLYIITNDYKGFL